MGTSDRSRRARKAAAGKRRQATSVGARGINAVAEAPAARHARSTAPPSRPLQPRFAMPPAIAQRFIAARNSYYFLGGGRAFVDRGDQLTTRSDKRAVVESFAAIAQARGWTQITMAGTDRFQQQMWLAARLAGLRVRDYPASTHLQAQLGRILARRVRPATPLAAPRVAMAPEPRAAGSVARAVERVPAPQEWRGRLLDHGPAPYPHDPSHRPSYVVTLETAEGLREIWGVDLKRAVQASVSRVQIGDAVVLRRVRQEPVTMRATRSDAQGVFFQEAPRQSHRNRYVIESLEFVAARAEMTRVVRDSSVSARMAIRQQPQLAGTYLSLRAAQLVANRLSHSADQRRFVDQVREGLAEAIARGEVLRAVRVRAPARSRASHLDRSTRAAHALP